MKLAEPPFSRTGIIGRNRHGIAVDQGHRGGDSMRAARECQQQERAGKIEASVTFHARENASSFFNAASTLTLWKFVKDNNLYGPFSFPVEAEEPLIATAAAVGVPGYTHADPVICHHVAWTPGHPHIYPPPCPLHMFLLIA